MKHCLLLLSAVWSRLHGRRLTTTWHAPPPGVLHWGGKLLALFENGLPYEMVGG
jgi:hypothetical protein